MTARSGAAWGIGAAAIAWLLVEAAPAHAGPPFVTDDPVPVEPGHWEIYGFSMGTVTHGDSAGILPGIDANYGALPNLHLHALLPVAWRHGHRRQVPLHRCRRR